MPAFLPPLLADQTLYSWCGLVHQMNSSTSARTTCDCLFGAPYAGLCHDFPAHLGTLSQRTRGHLGSSRELALRHTLLSYFLSTVAGAEGERILDLITEGAVPSLKMRLGITASRVGGSHPLKLCPDCSGEDKVRLGYTYWHIEHQFPSSFVCLKHARPLVFLLDSTTPVHRRYWITPDDHKGTTSLEVRVPSDTAMAVLNRLALDSRDLTLLPPGTLLLTRANGGYQRLLRQRDLATKRGNLRVAQLVSLVRERYRGLEGLPGMAPLSSLRDEWPGLVASLSRRRPLRAHPLKHLLLVGAITDNWAEFMRACETGCQADGTPPRIPQRPKRDQALRRFQQSITEGMKSISQASGVAGVSRNTGVQWAKRLGISFVGRGKLVTPSLAEDIRKHLSNGEPIGTIAASFGLSCSTVNRILGADEGIQALRHRTMSTKRLLLARTGFSMSCKSHSALPLSEVRKLPGNGYAWLYRNDRLWLSQELNRIGRLPRGTS